MGSAPLSIYFHWPYCKSKCPYCDFFKRLPKNCDQEAIINNYVVQLRDYHRLVPDRTISSVFFGGGTPSLLKPELIGRLLESINRLWPLEKDLEISLEANPNSEYPGMFSHLRNAGINRLSLGVQALNDESLHFLGRTHNLQQALHSIEEVLKYFDNHSMDLIYARPNQKIAAWQQELNLAATFGFKHLSLYQLTIEEGTVFAAKKMPLPDEKDAAAIYQFTVEYLRQKNYPRYEVSNFAPANYESKHNKCYWQGDEYIGIGETAHGRLKIDGSFYAIEQLKNNETASQDQIMSNEAFEMPIAKHNLHIERLSPYERGEELVIMGLRLQKGLNKLKFKQLCGLEFDSFVNAKAVNNLKQLKFISDSPANFALSGSGFLLMDKIIAELCS